MSAFRFCPLCASPLQGRSHEGRTLPTCASCGFVQWADPKLVAVVLIATQQGAWLLRRAISPGRGLWALPGGYVNADEHPQLAAVRECAEEIGVEVRIRRLLSIHHVIREDGSGAVVMAYSGRLLQGAPQTSEEATEVGCFPAGRLPELAFSTHRVVLERWVASLSPRAARIESPR